MTQIKDSIELDFCDVLFRQKRTTLNSRSEAILLENINSNIILIN